MNPNPDPFETALGALRRRELPASWRDEMLQAAAAAAATAGRQPAPARTASVPRWLVVGWSLAWAATVVMYFTMPAEPAASQAAGMAETAPPLLWQQRAAAIQALLAAN